MFINRRKRMRCIAEGVLLWDNHPIVLLTESYLYTLEAHTDIKKRFLCDLRQTYKPYTGGKWITKHNALFWKGRLPYWTESLIIDLDGNVALEDPNCALLYVSQINRTTVTLAKTSCSHGTEFRRTNPIPILIHCGNIFEQVILPDMKFHREWSRGILQTWTWDWTSSSLNPLTESSTSTARAVAMSGNWESPPKRTRKRKTQTQS